MPHLSPLVSHLILFGLVALGVLATVVLIRRSPGGTR